MLVELWDRIRKEVLELSFCLQYYYIHLFQLSFWWCLST